MVKESETWPEPSMKGRQMAEGHEYWPGTDWAGASSMTKKTL